MCRDRGYSARMDRILIADDDQEFCALLTEYLSGQGFAIDTVHDGARALQQVDQEPFDALVLDVMMPRMDGFAVLRALRASSDLPVLMLTARGDDVDRIVGLEMGADDYLPKPCNPRELAARLRAILRRRQGVEGERRNGNAKQRITVGDLQLNPGTREVAMADEPASLTSAEFDVLHALLRQVGTVVDKETLSQEALHRPLGAYDRSVDVHISNLRRKLGDHADGKPRIKTVRNRGYLYSLSS